MKLRHKKTQTVGYASSYNPCSCAEIIVYYDDGSASSEYISDYDVFLTKGPKANTWMDMSEAFDNKAIVSENNMNGFYEPD